MKKLITAALLLVSASAYACYTYNTTTLTPDGRLIICTCTVCAGQQTCVCV